MVTSKHSDQRLTKTPKSVTSNSLKTKFGFSSVKEKPEASLKSGVISPLKRKSIKSKINEGKNKEEFKRTGLLSPRKGIPKLELDVTPKSTQSHEKKLERKMSDKKVAKT